MKKILIVDDDVDMCLMLHIFLTRRGYIVTEVNSCNEAWDYLQHTIPDLVICDVWLKDMDGIEFLKKVKIILPELPFIFITAYDDIKTSANAIKYGALDYVTKPLLPDEIAAIVQRAFDKVRILKITESNNVIPNCSLPDFFYGNSELFKRVMAQINLVAPTNYSTIIQGENGTGKKIIGKEIHNRSNRKNKQYVAFKCKNASAEVTNNLLFGDVAGRGNTCKGSLELANGGTILLDEVTGLEKSTQLLLIKALKEKKLLKKGSSKEIEIDIRVLSTNKENLWHAVQNGKLIEDFYHLLNDFTIDALPLRNRKDDIMPFARYFLAAANEEMKKNILGFSPSTETIFLNYIWHDNLRELKNVITKAALLCNTDFIDASLLPSEICMVNKNSPFISRHEQFGIPV